MACHRPLARLLCRFNSDSSTPARRTCRRRVLQSRHRDRPRATGARVQDPGLLSCGPCHHLPRSNARRQLSGICRVNSARVTGCPGTATRDRGNDLRAESTPDLERRGHCLQRHAPQHSVRKSPATGCECASGASAVITRRSGSRGSSAPARCCALSSDR